MTFADGFWFGLGLISAFGAAIFAGAFAGALAGFLSAIVGKR